MKFRGTKPGKTASIATGLILALLLSGCIPGSPVSKPNAGSVEDMAWQGDSNLWVCGSERVLRLDIANETATSFDLNCNDILVAGDGTVWVADFGNIHSFDGLSWQRHTLPNKLVDSVHGGLLFEASNGTIWSGALGVGEYDPTSGSWQVRVPPLPNTLGRGDGYPREVQPGSVYAMLEVTGGMIFVASNVGIIRLDGANQQTWTDSDGLACDSVRSLLESRDGDVWAGTDCGISRWNGSAWQTLPPATSPDSDGNLITDLLLEASDGSVWATTWEGVARWNDSEWQSWSLASGLPHHRGVTALTEAQDGDIWAGTWGSGIVRWNGFEWKTYTTADGLTSNRVSAILADPAGAIVAGTADGEISYYDSATDRWRPFLETAVSTEPDSW